MKAVQIEKEDMLDMGRSTYSKAQMEEFLEVQDSQGTQQAYLTETAELAYRGRGEGGSWGFRLGDQGGPHRCGGLVPGAPLLPDGTLDYFYFAGTPCVEHGESDCVCN